MRSEQWLLVALSAGTIVAGLLVWQNNGDGMVQTEGVSLPTSTLRSTVPAQAATKLRKFPVPVDDAPLTEQVARLIATHNPASAYHAYRILADCAAFNADHDRLTFDEAEFKNSKPGYLPGFRGMNEREKLHDTKLCSGMTERERQSRLDYLSIAAKAGVPGSEVAFAVEGPFGDPTALKTRPGDPLVLEWKALAIAQLTRAAEAGSDIGVLQYLAAENYNGSDLTEKNLLLAYRYNVALGIIDGETFPESTLAKILAKDSEQMKVMAKDFSPEQRAAELVAAQRIVDNVKEQRKRARDNR